MADLKISALTGATTPLAGTEVLPIVQSSSTVKVSVANLTAGRAVSTGALTSSSVTTSADVEGLVTFGRFSAAYPWVLIRPTSTATGIEFRSNAGDAQLVITQATGNVTFSMGNLVQGTAAKGIDFTANTATAGSTSRLLNWYEEGTYTPTFTNLTVVNGTGGATYTGTYTRVGRLVYFTATITVTGSCTTASINGSTYVSLPFTAAPSAGSVGVADANAANLSNGLIAGAVCYMPTWSARNVAIYVGGTFSV